MREFSILRDYIDAKCESLAEWNVALSSQGVASVNARRITNLGTFRAYVEHYLRASPHVHQEMTLLVRQLQPTDLGLPLEIYCFTNNTDWVAYEQIQSDIFDHLLALLPQFGLRVFQSSSDTMLMETAQRLSAISAALTGRAH